jgi:hypothetical protein
MAVVLAPNASVFVETERQRARGCGRKNSSRWREPAGEIEIASEPAKLATELARVEAVKQMMQVPGFGLGPYPMEGPLSPASQALSIFWACTPRLRMGLLLFRPQPRAR